MIWWREKFQNKENSYLTIQTKVLMNFVRTMLERRTTERQFSPSPVTDFQTKIFSIRQNLQDCLIECQTGALTIWHRLRYPSNLRHKRLWTILLSLQGVIFVYDSVTVQCSTLNRSPCLVKILSVQLYGVAGGPIGLVNLKVAKCS